MASSSSNSAPTCACAVCVCLPKIRRSGQDCEYAPYFPGHDRYKLEVVNSIFGLRNAMNLLGRVEPKQRETALNSLAFEADARVRDPVYGCGRHIGTLQLQVSSLQAHLLRVETELGLAIYRQNEMGAASIAPTEPSSSAREGEQVDNLKGLSVFPHQASPSIESASEVQTARSNSQDHGRVQEGSVAASFDAGSSGGAPESAEQPPPPPPIAAERENCAMAMGFRAADEPTHNREEHSSWVTLHASNSNAAALFPLRREEPDIHARSVRQEECAAERRDSRVLDVDEIRLRQIPLNLLVEIARIGLAKIREDSKEAAAGLDASGLSGPQRSVLARSIYRPHEREGTLAFLSQFERPRHPPPLSPLAESIHGRGLAAPRTHAVSPSYRSSSSPFSSGASAEVAVAEIPAAYSHGAGSSSQGCQSPKAPDGCGSRSPVFAVGAEIGFGIGDGGRGRASSRPPRSNSRGGGSRQSSRGRRGLNRGRGCGLSRVSYGSMDGSSSSVFEGPGSAAVGAGVGAQMSPAVPFYAGGLSQEGSEYGAMQLQGGMIVRVPAGRHGAVWGPGPQQSGTSYGPAREFEQSGVVHGGYGGGSAARVREGVRRFRLSRSETASGCGPSTLFEPGISAGDSGTQGALNLPGFCYPNRRGLSVDLHECGGGIRSDSAQHQECPAFGGEEIRRGVQTEISGPPRLEFAGEGHHAEGSFAAISHFEYSAGGDDGGGSYPRSIRSPAGANRSIAGEDIATLAIGSGAPDLSFWSQGIRTSSSSIGSTAHAIPSFEFEMQRSLSLSLPGQGSGNPAAVQIQGSSPARGSPSLSPPTQGGETSMQQFLRISRYDVESSSTAAEMHETLGIAAVSTSVDASSGYCLGPEGSLQLAASHSRVEEIRTGSQLQECFTLLPYSYGQRSNSTVQESLSLFPPTRE